MPSSRKYDLLDISGGKNNTVKNTHIADSEAQALLNLFPYESRLRRRPGNQYVTSTAYAQHITAIFPYRLRTGAWKLLAGVESGFAEQVGVTLSAIPLESGVAIASDTEPWCMRQKNDVVYTVRKNDGRLFRVSDVARLAGLTAPSAAPVIADGGAGALSASDYTETYTFARVETIDGRVTILAESNESPSSNTLSLGANRRIAVSSIGVSTQPYVNARIVYRNVPGQSGRRFMVSIIADNVTTTLADNVIADLLGAAASINNGVPPTGLRWLEFFVDRLWVTDGRLIHPSEQNKPESFNIANALALFTDDGHEIRVLKRFGQGTNQRLIVGRTNLVAYVTGLDRSSFSINNIISDKYGCVAPESMQAAGEILFWYTGLQVVASDGSNAVPISDEKVAATLKLVPLASREKAAATIVPHRNWYLLSIDTDGDGQNDLTLCYNYKTRKWADFDWTFGVSGSYVERSPRTFAFFYGSQFEHKFYAAGYDKRIYDLDDDDQETDADGVGITWRARFKNFGFEQHNLKKGMRRVGVLCDSVPASLTARLYRDDVLYKTRSVSLNQTSEWKRLNLNSMKALSKTVSLELEYSGAPRVDLSALTFEIVGFERGGQPL